MTQFQFGNAPDVSQWGQYNIAEVPLTFNGEETRYKAVVQNGKIAQIGKKSYTVLPNEEAVKIGDMAAKECGLVPFHEFTGSWFQRMKTNVILDGWQVHALYANNTPYDVNGDKMHLGVGVHNSIDGNKSFGAGIFTFRHACKNMVLAGSRGYVQEFDMRRTIDFIYQKHVGDADRVLSDLAHKITLLMDKSVGIIDAYNEMARKKADEDFRRDFLKRLQRVILPKKLLPDYLQVKPKEALPPMVEELTVWDVYNEITANVWHDQGKARLENRIKSFDALHKIIPLSVQVS